MAKKKLIEEYFKLQPHEFAQHCAGIVTLLLQDHQAMRFLMRKFDSQRASTASKVSRFTTLEKLVHSHMAAEEKGLVNFLKLHPKFENEALESYEEHRIHEQVFQGIRRLKSMERKLSRMHIYCEMLEHHLKEEEQDLFPRYKKYFALSTRKRSGVKFLKTRLSSSKRAKRRGALSG